MKNRMFVSLMALAVLAGCTSLWMGAGYEEKREGASSSLVDYLYPDGQVPPSDWKMPYLSLPVRVGIAFVPTFGEQHLTANEKQDLLLRVSKNFVDRDYVQSIATIPDNYLRSAKGVTGMKQVASLYGVDVMALVSYDQMTFSSERDSALLYWTIVGALVVKGNSNEVHTMIDTAVFDVATGNLLFRAPGLHRDQANATLMDSETSLRQLRRDSFVAATDHMITNLDGELDTFREAVHAGQAAQVEWRQGQGGMGSLSWPLVALLLVILLARWYRRV